MKNDQLQFGDLGVSRSDKKKIKVKGLVIPQAWDEVGNIIAVSIFTNSEEEYCVVMDDIGKTLIGQSSNLVIIEGHLDVGNKDENWILVEKFQKLKNFFPI